MKELAFIFLRLGILGFGGPLATISMMEEEVVKKRRWITPEQFSKSFALLKVFPGPVATQLAIHLGRLRAGRWGGVAAGLLFILPSFFFILALGILLDGLTVLSWKNSFVGGMQVASLGVIFHGAYRLAKTNLKKDFSLLIVALSFLAVLLKPNMELFVILFFGFLGLLAYWKNWKLRESVSLSLVYVCIKAALFTFGTGLAIVPLLESDVVQKYKWLTHAEFLDALALGQITPGPVVITVTWVGYKLMHLPGAILATMAIFAPGFIVVLFLVPIIEKKWGSAPALQSFYKYAVPAVVGAMIAVSIKLLWVSVSSPQAGALFVASLVLVFWRQTPSWFVIPFLGLISIFLK